MRFSLVLAVFHCLTTWMSTVHATIGPDSDCCPQWSDTKVRVHKIVDYTNQSEGVCPIRAVVFQTRSGKRICSDPDSDWARKAMQKVDEKREKKALQKKVQDEEGSASVITSAVSSTSKKAPQNKRRNGRRRQRNKSRGMKKWQKKAA
ncbi:eotaxin-like isoform X4 [Plectropomus leopardus]|uniref:eotaxin-like isoform X4 n=1 Tax=Plectropomus leopardus TaxID=160734 RepID=UPI001C4B1DC8|nr:eotaxin-like isoform X4 [Plectropomus leopardus]